MKRSWWESSGSTLAGVLIVTCLVFGLIVYNIGLEQMSREMLAGFAGFGAIYLIWFLVALSNNEAIDVGRDYLEHRKNILWFHSTHRFTNATLRIETRYGIQRYQSTMMVGKVPVPGPVYYYHVWNRSLYVCDNQQTFVLFRSSETGRDSSPAPKRRDFSRNEATRLAAFVGGVTQWPVHDEPVTMVS